MTLAELVRASLQVSEIARMVERLAGQFKA